MSDQNLDTGRRSIAAATGVGAVHIGVTDGERAGRFYREVLGLAPQEGDDGLLRFGAGGRELLVVHPGASGPVVPRTTGLYHFAIVVPNKRELARVIGRLISLKYPNSPTDHVMTKADYLWDPDGNGIEVYAETPEDGTFGFKDGDFYAVDSLGRVRSGRDPIDLEELFANLEPEDRFDAPMPAGTKMGHIHLHVRDVAEAVHFYSDLMGFDVMGSSNELGAAFVSAGGYHHHLGLNTWAGQGAPPPPATSAGLRHFTVELPTSGDLQEVAERLDEGGAKVAESADGYVARDPSSNKFRLVSRAQDLGR